LARQVALHSQHWAIEDQGVEKSDAGDRQRQLAECMGIEQAGVGGNEREARAARKNARREIDAAMAKQSH